MSAKSLMFYQSTFDIWFYVQFRDFSGNFCLSMLNLLSILLRPRKTCIKNRTIYIYFQKILMVNFLSICIYFRKCLFSGSGSVPGVQNTLHEPHGRAIPRWNRLGKRIRSMKKNPASRTARPHRAKTCSAHYISHLKTTVQRHGPLK